MYKNKKIYYGAIKSIIVLFIMLLLASSFSFAQTTWYWTNANNTGIWSDPLNWTNGSTTGLPQSDDDVSFDPTYSTADCNIDNTGGYNFNALTIESGYTGTVTQNYPLTVVSITVNSGTFNHQNNLTIGSTATSDGFLTIQGGTFNGYFSTGYILNCNGSFTLTSGTFNAPGGTLRITRNFTVSGGTFNHNNGIIKLNTYSNTVRAITVTGNLTLNELHLEAATSPPATSTQAFTFTIVNTIDVATLVINFGSSVSTRRISINTGTINVSGNLFITGATTSELAGGNAVIRMNGTADQIIASSYTNPNVARICNFRIVGNTSRNIVFSPAGRCINVNILRKEGSSDVTLIGGTITARGNFVIPNTGGTFTIAPDAALNILGNFTIQSGRTITIQSNTSGKIGSFALQGSQTIASTAITRVERYISPDAWHYFCSPTAQTMSDKFWGMALYSYNEPTFNWTAHNYGYQLANMRGYDIYKIGTGQTVVLDQGGYNNGTLSISLSSSYDGFNLVGNPYPSTIDWDAPTGWTRSNVENAHWIWDGTQIITYGGGVGLNTGSQYIPATQGFFVHATASTTLGVTNAVRTPVITQVVRGNSLPRDVLRIKISSNKLTDEAAIRFTNNASEDYDLEYDVTKMFNQNPAFPQVYSKTKYEKDLAIQALPYSNSPVELYIRPGSNALNSLSFDFSSMNDVISIYLEDLKENIIQDIRLVPEYRFTATTEDPSLRFLLHFTMPEKISSKFQDSISTPENIVEEAQETEFRIYSHNKDIIINCPENSENSGIVEVFNLIGKKVFESNLTLSPITRFRLDITQGVYIVKVTTPSGSLSEKVIIK